MNIRTEKMTRREDFLKRFWRPYPKAPKGTLAASKNPSEDQWVGGTIVAFRKTSDGERQVQIFAQGRSVTLNGKQITLVIESSKECEDAANWDAELILIEGDKVAAQVVNRVIRLVLLAPQRTESRPLPLTVEMAKSWQEFLASVRKYFTDQGFIEVHTPTMVVCPGYEPTLQPIPCEVEIDGVGHHRFLPTSPELHLKKVLAQSWSEIFEIRSCFRDGEVSNHHQPEFTMLEWYQSYVGIEGLMAQLENLIRFLVESPSNASNTPIEFSRRSVAELFEQHVGYVLTPLTTQKELRRILSLKGLHFSPEDSWSDLFHRLWLEFVEPWIVRQEQPILITQFPPAQAALSRISESGWAERVELYWRGLEIANGFDELNDPEEQSRRAEADLQLRQKLGRRRTENDLEFIQALYAGMPPCSGIAVGLERLFMAREKIERIQNIKAFPY